MNLFLLLLILIIINKSIALSDETIDDKIDINEESKAMIGSKEEFKIFFKEKRRQQLSAVKTLQSFGKYEQKYSMVNNVFNKVFEVQEKAKLIIENSSYILGSDLPKDQTLLESLSNIIENCAFFGDIVLKLPDISHRVLKSNNKFISLYKWCISFSMASNLIDDKTIEMFDLLAQELDIIPKNDNFINPYKKSNKKVKIETQTNSNSNKKSVKKVKKGPRLSRKTEL
jgi:hypothetical protein